jgi:hypothetical protein
MKGVALPIEVLVIIVIAVIVLLGMVAVYFAGWTPFAETSGIDAIKNNACRKLAYDCSKSPTDITVEGVSGITNLQELCDTYFGTAGSDEACKRICGCGGDVTISGGGSSPPSPPPCSCGWVSVSGISCPATNCYLNSVRGIYATCKCNDPGCGRCLDSQGIERQGDTGYRFCIVCPWT